MDSHGSKSQRKLFGGHQPQAMLVTPVPGTLTKNPDAKDTLADKYGGQHTLTTLFHDVIIETNCICEEGRHDDAVTLATQLLPVKKRISNTISKTKWSFL